MSGKPAARKSDTVSCPRCGGTAIDSGSPNVFFDGLLAARVTDCTTCGSILTMAAMSSVQINGQAALVTGSQGTHGDTITGGSSSIIIGNSFTPAPVSPVAPMSAHLVEPSNYQSPVTASAPSSSPIVSADDSVLEEEEEEEELDKEKPVGITLRIGVFFDGTLNNANNSMMGQLCGATHAIKSEDLDASCRPYMADPESSYANDTSNIKKLSELYFSSREVLDEGKLHLKFETVYVDGIGTSSGQPDSMLGASMGRGEMGVTGKVDEAFKKIGRAIYDFSQTYPDSKIIHLTFDTFGFSRGAAAARHFSNEVALGQSGPLGNISKIFRGAFHQAYSVEYQHDVQMGFIGLFDTVPSVGGLANLGYIRSQTQPGLKLYLPRRLFPNVVQLAARDEIRANFALNRVKPDHLEITLPGVHSDLGGGYFPQSEENLLISPMQVLVVTGTTDVKYTSIYRDAQRVKAQWEAKGWPSEMLEIVTPYVRGLPPSQQNSFNPDKLVYAALQLKRPVRGELSRVYLRVMYALAKERGVRFKQLDEQYPSYTIPAELQALSERFVAGDYSTTPAEEQLLRLKYIHTSASWNPPTILQGSTPRTSAELLYFNAPTTDGIRVQHPHVPD
ncbi:PAAR domain-containing protein [Pseudomonas sp. fls2-241-R2A-110]|uniref:PAAR domain-containing protein n=1 Tax=Pseudomonas sp. fls2-241-R2A-110 TaxID=3040311 RepID=UPI0025577AD2|nr:PAAR domain-containing protein [Pseudomonas sp. fls2-241-R2A-110]